MGSGCFKSSSHSVTPLQLEKPQESRAAGRDFLRAAPSEDTSPPEAGLPSLPHALEEEVSEAPRLGPLVAALVAQKLEHVLQEEVPIWDTSCCAFGRLQPQQDTEQDAHVHQKARVHRDFLTRLEAHFQDVCSDVHMDIADVARLLQDESSRSEVARLMVDRLLKYTDYHAFEKLMHRHYWAMVKEVRLFWDIENVGWDDMQQNGREVVRALRNFLDTKNIGGFAAQMWAVAPTWRFADHPHVVDDLEDAAIRAVNCKSKPEAADHVIKGEIEKAALLYGKYQVPASSIVFIVITSDQDFTDVLQKLQYSGYKTVLIHNAKDGSRHVDMMSLHASHAYTWKEVLPPSFRPAPCPARKSGKSDWQKLVDWARGRVHPPVWVNGMEDQEHIWLISLQFGRGLFPKEICLSKGETRNAAAGTALEALAQLLGQQAEANIEQRALHATLSKTCQAEPT